MKAVVQRVAKASVSVSGQEVGSIGKGFFVLLGVGVGDSLEIAEVLAKKVEKLRIMADDQDKMNLTLKDVGGEVLVVSQFTLYADTSAGNRPSFVKAEKPEVAKEIYEHFVSCLRQSGLVVATGSFGKYMDIKCELDGPTTILYEI